MRKSLKDRIFDFCVICFLLAVAVVTLYPFLHITAVSFSSSQAVSQYKVSFYPIGFNLQAYKAVLDNPSIWTGYFNTILYTTVGTAINIMITTVTAYALSKKDLYAKRFFSAVFVFTMFFSGGMIPNYIVVKNLGLLDTMWAVILPPALSTYNMIIMRTYFEGFSEELEDAARIDGCSPLGVLWRIILPVSAPIMLTISLYYAVFHWNSYFHPMLYLQTKKKFPLQVFLQQILISGETAFANASSSIDSSQLLVSEAVKYATIIVAVLPIIILYPFIQKYFTKGALTGSVKG